MFMMLRADDMSHSHRIDPSVNYVGMILDQPFPYYVSHRAVVKIKGEGRKYHVHFPELFYQEYDRNSINKQTMYNNQTSYDVMFVCG